MQFLTKNIEIFCLLEILDNPFGRLKNPVYQNFIWLNSDLLE